VLPTAKYTSRLNEYRVSVCCLYATTRRTRVTLLGTGSVKIGEAKYNFGLRRFVFGGRALIHPETSTMKWSMSCSTTMRLQLSETNTQTFTYPPYLSI